MSQTDTANEHERESGNESEDDDAEIAKIPDRLKNEQLTEIAQNVVTLAEHYLGFAAREYLDRQARLHLDKPLNELRREDLDNLAMWVNNTAPLIMNDSDGQQLAEEIFELKSTATSSQNEDAPDNDTDE